MHYGATDSFEDNILAGGVVGDPGVGTLAAGTDATERNGEVTETITLGAKTCDYCTLQWIWAANGDGGSYLMCIDISITTDGQLPDFNAVPSEVGKLVAGALHRSMCRACAVHLLCHVPCMCRAFAVPCAVPCVRKGANVRRMCSRTLAGCHPMCQALRRRRCRRVSSRGRPLPRVTSEASPPVAQTTRRSPHPVAHSYFHLPTPRSRRLSPSLHFQPPPRRRHPPHPYPNFAGGRRRRRCGRPGDRRHRRSRRRGRRSLLVHQGALLAMALLTMALLTMASSTGTPRCGARRRGKAVTPCTKAKALCTQPVTLLHLGCTTCVRCGAGRYLRFILRYLPPQVRGKTAGPGAPPAALEAAPPPPPPAAPSDLPPGWQQAADPTTGTAARRKVAHWDIPPRLGASRHGSAAQRGLLGQTRWAPGCSQRSEAVPPRSP